MPPEQFLGRLWREFEGHYNALLDGLRDLTRTAAPPGSTWNLTGSKNRFSYARQMIEQAVREAALMVGDDDELDELLAALQEAQARGVVLTVITPTPYDAGGVAVTVHRQGLRLRTATGHGFTLVVDGQEALIGEVDRGESALWTTNGYAVAWTLWCLKQEMAGLPAPAKPASTEAK